MRDWLHAVAERLRSTATPTASGLAFQGPRLPIFLVMLALPLALSGAVRTVTSLSLPLALALVLLGWGCVVALRWPGLRRRVADLRGTARLVALMEVAGMLPVAFAIWALYVRDFGGFPNLDGWDGGSHVFMKDHFGASAPSLYSGQVSYFACTWWLEKLLGLDSFHSFMVAFYVTVAATVAFPVAIAFAVVRQAAASHKGPLLAGILATVAGTLAISWWVVLPLLHYNQAAGYYVHVFGLVPLVLLWAADALVRAPAPRVAALLVGFAFLRYSYSLNLADAALAVACVLGVEGFRGRWRIAQAVLVASLVGALVVILPELRPIFRMWGGMQRFDVDSVLTADLVIAGAALLYLLTTIRQEAGVAWVRGPLARAVRFPLGFGLASSGLLSVLRRGAGVQYYYVTKYEVWPCILLAFVAVVLLAHLVVVVTTASSWRRLRTWLRVVLVAAVVATVPALWQRTFAGYRTTLLERMRAPGPNYQHLHAVADLEAIARVKRVLQEQHKQFGGYLTAFFPRFSFMNAALGRHAGYQEFFPPAAQPGYCVFWVSPERDIHRLGPAHLLDALRSVVAGPNRVCAEYPVPWKPTPQSLCYRCF